MSVLETLNPESPHFPPLLQHMRGSPKTLYIEGDSSILSTTCISVVGARTMSDYAARVIQRLIPPLTRCGLTIVSGLALGVDAYVHKIALEYGGSCIVVLGSGFNHVYPERNKRLYTYILAKGGCAISEYPPDTEARPYHFPERNRIVAGLSAATLIIEAGEQSGTLITARCALDAGREVLVVPADITRAQSRGITQLLRQGATPIESAEDVLKVYSSQVQLTIPELLQPALTGSLATLYDLISHGVEQVDQLIGHCGLGVSEVQSILSVLELDGYIYCKENRWQKT